MDRESLKRALQIEKICPTAYDLAEGTPENESYVIRESFGVWNVFYSERGREIGKREFYSEAEACQYLLETLRNDPTTRVRE
jgi:hypothetical protein